MTRIRQGFTLVEMMIVMSVIGLLVTLAMPFWFRAQDSAIRNTCINNLRVISIGKEMCAISDGKANGALVTEDDLNRYLKRPFSDLEEPRQATYEINAVGVDPTCTYTVPHELP